LLLIELIRNEKLVLANDNTKRKQALNTLECKGGID
jgi:hypothetical protein